MDVLGTWIGRTVCLRSQNPIAVVGQTYTVQSKDDLNATNWNFEAQINARMTNVIAILSATTTNRFYRIKEEP